MSTLKKFDNALQKLEVVVKELEESGVPVDEFVSVQTSKTRKLNILDSLFAVSALFRNLKLSSEPVPLPEATRKAPKKAPKRKG